VPPCSETMANAACSLCGWGAGPESDQCTSSGGLGHTSEPMSKIFFYGLFMDRSRLAEKGLQPAIIGPAVLPDYRIHIGERATLLRCASRRAYGIVMELADQEARALYSEPSVREYIRERVRVELLATAEAVEAYCYNLPRELGLAGANPGYATELSRLVEALQFDSAYVKEIAAFGEVS
jgi:hypothetical protein